MLAEPATPQLKDGDDALAAIREYISNLELPPQPAIHW